MPKISIPRTCANASPRQRNDATSVGFRGLEMTAVGSSDRLERVVSGKMRPPSESQPLVRKGTSSSPRCRFRRIDDQH